MTGICEAPRELLALAVAVRPDWDRDEAWDALLACRAAGWEFTRTLLATVRLLVREDAEPRELVHASRPPLAPGQPGTLDAALRAEALQAAEAATKAQRQQKRSREPGGSPA
jgi:hypothetical protein